MTDWKVDRTGFPLIQIPKWKVWINFFPITKLQFEDYLAIERTYGDNWYSELLKLNPRISFRTFDENNYENLFLTGIRISEAIDFAEWLGEGYSIPQCEEWQQAYNWFASQATIRQPECWDDLCQPAKEMWQTLYSLKQSGTLAEQALLEDGILEWVSEKSGPHKFFGGMGRPRSEFFICLRTPDEEPLPPVNSEARACLKAFGMRLLWRAI